MIIHIDMDAFYASVEQHDNPELKGKCVIVGREFSRGVVSAASYEARKFGVHSAMPVFQARKICPEAIFVPPRMKRYKEVSVKIMAVLFEFSPLVEQLSIDEAFVDITGCGRLFGSPYDIAKKMKQDILDAVGLTCSAGIAPNKFLAKIASDLHKPDGITQILPEDTRAFIETLPIQKVPGVGKTTYQILAKLSVRTLGDIQHIPEKILQGRLGKYGKRLISLSKGIDDSPVSPVIEHKSISTETTLSSDTEDKNFLKTLMLSQAEEVGRDLRKNRLKAKTINIKITYSDFKKISRSKTIGKPTQSSHTIYNEAWKLLENLNLEKPVRLVGVGTSSLFPESLPVQIDLFKQEDKENNWNKIEQAMDSIHRKYGSEIIKKGSLNTSGPAPERLHRKNRNGDDE